ncbi:MAG: twitching motility protein PilT, partial [Candidatus Parcubacteria bacterium]|nr:twitching motility protein PilT [Candidatus Parcubacteria bacterium]
MSLNLPQIFQRAVELKASDVHLLTNQAPVFRIDGVLQKSEFPALSSQDLINLVAPLIDRKQKI